MQEACQRAAGSEFCLDARAKKDSKQSSCTCPPKGPEPEHSDAPSAAHADLGRGPQTRRRRSWGRSALLFSSASRQRSLTNSIPRAADTAVFEAPWPPVESYTENPLVGPRDSRVVSAPRSVLSR